MRIKLQKETAEGRFDFGPGLPGNIDRDLGEEVFKYQSVRKTVRFFEKGLKMSFFFHSDGLREIKRWQDIEHIYIIPVTQILRFGYRDKVWIQFETLDLKASGFWIDKKDINIVLDVLKSRFERKWDEIYVGKNHNNKFLKHKDLEKFSEVAKKTKW